MEQAKLMFSDLLSAHKQYILENITTVDEDVAN